MTGVAEKLEPQERTHRATRGNHFGTREGDLAHQAIEPEGDEHRHEEEEPPEFGAKLARREVKLADVGNGRGGGACGDWALFVSTARQPSKAFLVKDGPDGWSAEPLLLVREDSRDVVDRVVAFTESHHFVAKG